jgi:hypothetical protein
VKFEIEGKNVYYCALAIRLFLRGTTIVVAEGRSTYLTRCSVSIVVTLLVYIFFFMEKKTQGTRECNEEVTLL